MNVRNSDVDRFRDNDILIYDQARKEFYKTTAETFFGEYEKKLNNLLKRYDEKVETLIKQNNEFTENTNKNIQNFNKEITSKIVENESKVRKEVDNFVAKMTSKIELFEKDSNLKYSNLKLELNKFCLDFVEKNKAINEKLIIMVENFIKTGGR